MLHSPASRRVAGFRDVEGFRARVLVEYLIDLHLSKSGFLGLCLANGNTSGMRCGREETKLRAGTD